MRTMPREVTQRYEVYAFTKFDFSYFCYLQLQKTQNMNIA